MSIDKKIEQLRNEMYNAIINYGPLSTQAIKASQKLDEVINLKMKGS